MTQSLDFPKFQDNKSSKRLAVRVRRAYKHVLTILEYTKKKKPRKVSLLCSQLTNSEALPLLPKTEAFVRLVSYHVSSGKFRKNSYRVLLRMAPTTLAELERRVRDSQFLFPEQVKIVGRNKLQQATIKKPKPTLAFNALEDLERIKQLVLEKKEPVREIVQEQINKSRKQKTSKTSKKLTGASDSLDSMSGLAKSVTEDDALVFNKLNRERKDIDLDIGECKMLKRGVVMLGTHIPNIVWKKVFAGLGLQIVAKQYITSMYAPVIAAPAEIDGDVLDPEVVLNHATQLVALHNKKQRTECDMLEIVGDPFKLSNATHWWYLALPKCVVNHASFRFGSWHFTKPPRTRTAYAAEVIED